ncbi:hypothetical protein BaRGS_00016091, partial [Batillaria attramentaria]
NYTRDPRLAGTAQDDDLSKMIEQEWRVNGLEGVHLATYDVLLPFPNKSDPNMGAPVYVNYGRIEDFQFLANNYSINFTGRVVIARYGKIFRGDKVHNAERFNASAVILYSDPYDFNKQEGSEKPYPDSWWLPPTGMQRGTVYIDNGDPQTFLYPSTYYAHRTSEQDARLPKIPCQPIGYGDAVKFLKDIDGDEAPGDWQGKLPFKYHIGPGYMNGTDLQVRVVVNNYMKVKPVHNVIGYIKGSEEPDRYVLLGNHHDAWVFGALDPLSGSATLTEITRVFGLMLQKGHRPRRTLVFCSWDAEESGLMGSVEWVEDNLKLLQQRGVAYLNVDYAVDGHYSIAVGSSPLLQDVLYAVAKKVSVIGCCPSPNATAASTLYELWKQRPVGNGQMRNPSPGQTRDSAVTLMLARANLSRAWPTSGSFIYSLGSGSDMAAFYQRAGVPSVDMWMTYDEVRYETFFFYDTYIDPGFNFTKAMAQMWALTASELANAELLPFKVERYSQAVSSFLDSLMESFEQQWDLHKVNVDAFKSAVSNFTKATKTFQQNLNTDKNLNNSLHVRIINDCLMQLERAFLDPEGLPGRKDQKHVMFAPSQFDAYTDSSFPGIVDTMFEIENGEGQWEQLKQQVYIATYIIQSAASTLEDVGL